MYVFLLKFSAKYADILMGKKEKIVEVNNKNINNVVFGGLRSFIKKVKGNGAQPEKKEFDKSAQEIMHTQGMAYVEMCKKSEASQIKELTEIQFEQKKIEIQGKIDNLPDNIKEKFNSAREDLNKYNIFVMQKLLDNPELAQNTEEIGDIIKHTTSKEEAQSKCVIIDKIAGNEVLKTNDNIAKLTEYLISSTNTEEEARARCCITDKIMENEYLRENSNIMSSLGDIICSSHSDDYVKSKCGIIDRIMADKDLRENQNVTENLGEIICFTDTRNEIARYQIIDRIMRDSVLKENENVIKNLGEIISSVFSEEDTGAKCRIAEKIMGDKELRKNKNLVNNLGEIMTLTTSGNEAAKCSLIDKITGDVNLKNNDYIMQRFSEIINTARSEEKVQAMLEFMSKISENQDMSKYITEIILNQKEDFYRENGNELTEIYKKSEGKIGDLLDKGYKMNFQKLQNSDEINIILEKSGAIKDSENGLAEVRNEARFNKNGIISKSRCEVFNLENEILEHTTTSDGKYSCDSHYRINEEGRKILTKEIRIINGKNGPVYVQKTEASKIMDGVFDTTIYNLDEIDENIDAIKAIDKGEIRGTQTAKTTENPDGIKTHTEEFQRGEFHTKREYSENNEGTKTRLNYTIKNSEGKKILNIERKFELQGNKSISTLNGREYISEFNDEEMTVKIGGTKINFKDKTKNETPENRAILWNLIKRTPGDLILNFKDIENLKYRKDNGSWDCGENSVESADNLGIMAHEMGHYLDSTQSGLFSVSEIQEMVTKNGIDEDEKITHNPELIKVYTEEFEEFKKNISEAEQKNIQYFSQTGGHKNTGLSEVVAEVNVLCTTQRNLDLQTRSMYLTKYFPKTTAKAAELLGYDMA